MTSSCPSCKTPLNIEAKHVGLLFCPEPGCRKRLAVNWCRVDEPEIPRVYTSLGRLQDGRQCSRCNQTHTYWSPTIAWTCLRCNGSNHCPGGQFQRQSCQHCKADREFRSCTRCLHPVAVGEFNEKIPQHVRCQTCSSEFRDHVFPLRFLWAYDLGEWIATGSISITYVATSYRRVAERKAAVRRVVKVLRWSDSRIDVIKETAPLRFREELKTFKFLGRAAAHAVNKYYHSDLGVTPPYFVLEFVEGVPVGEYLTEHPDLSVDRRLKTLTSLLMTLVTLHGCRVIHCGVNPDNILVRKNNTVKLCGLGFAVRAGKRPSGLAPGQLGLKRYMAPELLDHPNAKPTVRCDIYSSGAVMLDLLTKAAGDEQFSPIKLDRLPDPGKYGISERVWQVMLRALEPQPNKRFRSAGAFLYALKRAVRTPGRTGRVARKPDAGNLPAVDPTPRTPVRTIVLGAIACMLSAALATCAARSSPHSGAAGLAPGLEMVIPSRR